MEYSTYEHPVFDSDHHLYETIESFTRYLPKEFAGAVRYIEVNGRTKIALRNRISEYIPNPTFTVVAAPGSGMEYFAGKNTTGKSFRDIVTPMKSIPAFTSPEARLALMDEMHLDATLLFPTLASVIEVNFMDDPDLTLALVHGFNQWMYDEWTFNVDNRILSTPIINMGNCDAAIKELEWVLERGARAILVRPAPAAGYHGSRSPFLPEFDPFWARVQDSGVLLAQHSSDSGYQADANRWLGRGGREFLPFEPDAFSLLCTQDRPIMDTLSSAIAHGMLSRFPGIKLAVIECGSKWLHPLIDKFESVYGKVPQMFPEHPVEVLTRQVYINPFWEDPLDDLVEVMGVDHVLFGSDWPHPEGLADPLSWAAYCRAAGFSEPDVAKMMGGNLFDLCGIAA